MPSMLRRRPSPAMIVALIALFVALGGSVYAAANLDGHAVERGSLPGNRIVDDSVRGRQIREASLGAVRNAGNASALEGIRSTAFSRAASSATDSNAIPAPSGGSGTARAVTLTAPQNGFVLAIASASLFNNNDNDNFRCILRLDEVDQGQSLRKGQLFFNTESQENCDTAALFPVTQGAHTVKFNFADLDNTTVVDAAELDLVFVPFAG